MPRALGVCDKDHSDKFTSVSRTIQRRDQHHPELTPEVRERFEFPASVGALAVPILTEGIEVGRIEDTVDDAA